MAQIVKTEIFHVPYLLPGYKLSFGTISDVEAILLKLTDADGVFGWGEANPFQPFTEEGPSDVADVLRLELLPLVLDADDPDPAHIDQLLDDVRPGKHLIAKGAVSMALLDILGKRRNVPVAELLGEVLRRSLPVSYPLGNGSIEDDIEVIDDKMKQGFIDFMIKMGIAPVPEEIERVAALEARYGDTVRFKADANGGWTRAQSAQFLEGVKHSHLAFIEQPVAKSDIDGMEMLTKSTQLLVSVDESLTGMTEAVEIARRGAATVFSIKSSKNGGPLRSKALAELAKSFDILCYFNSMGEGGITQAASLHLAMTTPNILDIGHAYMSTLRLKGDVTNFPSFIRDGVVSLPEGPGLGIEVDEAKVRSSALISRTVEKT